MKQMKELLAVEQKEIDRLLEEIENIYERLYVKTSDIKGIVCWEKEYGIFPNTSLTIEQRRAQVLAKINSNVSATKEMLENLVKQVLGADHVNIVEYPEEYRFVIYVGTRYFAENMKLADAAVDEARPAHLAYRFVNSLYRKYRCSLYFGVTGCTRKTAAGIVNTEGLNIDKYRCGLYIGVAGCIRKKVEGKVDTDGLSFDE